MSHENMDPEAMASFEAMLHPEVVAAFNMFSGAAGWGSPTGLSHPSAQSAWVSFLITAHRRRADEILDPTAFLQWLEANGWVNQQHLPNLRAQYSLAFRLLDAAGSPRCDAS